MSLTFFPKPFDLGADLRHWAIVMVVIVVVSFLTAIVTSILALGFAGPLQVLAHMIEGFKDLLGTSPRRCLALTQLTFREALRRKTLWVFAVFALLFLFAGWFMSDVTADSQLQVKNYVSFVLRTISWLILPVALLLACWGLPEDIKARSLHTVVTKPVRRHEIVIGRILGYSAIAGLVLAVMSVIGILWINRQLPDDMRSQLIARVPVYGDIRFVDNDGNDKDNQGNVLTAGINVGDEDMFRSFIEGNTKASAIWEFSKLEPKRFDDGGRLKFESSFQSFRTYKGNIERQLMCQYTLVNPAKKIRVQLKPFEVHEFRRNVYDVAEQNKTLEDVNHNNEPVDLSAVIEEGTLQVEVRCLSSAQFLGMARPDLFIRLPDHSFAVSYFKSIVNIGLMMVMVVVLGVMSGCFAKGPVATMLTAFVILVGLTAHDFMKTLVTGKVAYNPTITVQGTGVMDSLYRIPKHMTPGVELDDSFGVRMMKTFDNIELNGLWAIQHVIPDFASYDTSEYVANAFDVPWAAAMLPNLLATLGYCFPWIIVGYFSLRLRELEAK